MKVFQSIEEIRVDRSCAVSVGTFDGLHLGHISVLEEMIRKSKEKNLATFVYTFKNNPAAYLKGEIDSPQIMDEEEKQYVLKEKGIDHLASLPFDETQISMSADDFVHFVLRDKIRAESVVVGHDFRFGHGGTSTASDLREYGIRYGFETSVIDPVLYEGVRISSTDIRKLLKNGEMRHASRLMGREFFLIGNVINGAAIGRKNGIPTINFEVSASLIMKRGVYFTTCEWGNRIYPSITNIGFKPTVSSDHKMGVETHLLDFEGNLYGQKVKVNFLKWHREERRFSDIPALYEQIFSDISEAKLFFAQMSSYFSR